MRATFFPNCYQGTLTWFKEGDEHVAWTGFAALLATVAKENRYTVGNEHVPRFERRQEPYKTLGIWTSLLAGMLLVKSMDTLEAW